MIATQTVPINESAQRHIEEIRLKAETLMIPLGAMAELTYRCNTDCVHCYCKHLTNVAGRRELSTEEWQRALDELAGLGVIHLAFTGGEIFSRQDFWHIAHHARSLHFSLTLFTNGTLIDEATADLLAELKPISIDMTLLGATEATHDRLTRTEGSFARTLRAAEFLRERRLPFLFKTPLMTGNFGELFEIEKVARLSGCRKYSRGTDITPCNDGNLDPLKWQLGEADVLQYLADERTGVLELPEEQADRRLSLEKPLCGAAWNACALNPYGDFLPCTQLLIPFGNVRDRSLADMWENPPEAITRIRNAKTYGQLAACLECDLIDYCRRCHGLAQLETGNWDSCHSLAVTDARLCRQLAHQNRNSTGEPERNDNE